MPRRRSATVTVSPVAALKPTARGNRWALVDVALAVGAWGALFLSPLGRRLFGDHASGAWAAESIVLALLIATPTVRAVQSRIRPGHAIRAAAAAIGADQRPTLHATAWAWGSTMVVISVTGALLAHFAAPPGSAARAAEAAGSTGSLTALALGLFVSTIPAGLGEELLRAGLAQRLGAVFGQDRPVWALLASTGVWVTGHLDYNLTGVILVTVVGLMLAAWYKATGSIWTVVIVHALIDITTTWSIYTG